MSLDVQGDVATFKATIYSLTGVPVNRQKLLCRKSWKGQLKDDEIFGHEECERENEDHVIRYEEAFRLYLSDQVLFKGYDCK